MRKRKPTHKKKSESAEPAIGAIADSIAEPKWLWLVVALASLTVYLNSFQGAFLFDDFDNIVEERRIREWPSWSFLLESRRPVVTLSLAANYAISGSQVWSYHVFNVAVHIFAALTLFGLVRRTLLSHSRPGGLAGSASWFALSVSLIWSVHPLLTQSVSYIIQRGESVMGLFYLLTLYCLLRSANSSPRAVWQVAAVLSCSLGMASKPVMVTAPIMALLFDRFFLSRSFSGAFRERTWLYVGLSCTWCVLLICGVVQSVFSPETQSTVGFGVQGTTPRQYALTQIGVMVHYLKLAFWPASLCLDYTWPVATTFAEVGVPAAVLLVVPAMCVFSLRRAPWVAFCGLFFFVILAPTSSIVPIQDVIFEHRMYLPLAAVVVVSLAGGNRLVTFLCAQRSGAPRVRRIVSTAAVVALAVVFGILTINRNRDYRYAARMWTDVVAKQPTSARAYFNLGNALSGENNFAEAARAYRRSLELRPLPRTSGRLAETLSKLGQSDEAIAIAREVLRTNPDHAEGYSLLGSLLVQQNQFAEAAPLLRTAVTLDPTDADAHSNIGVVLGSNGQFAEALSAFGEAARLEPDSIDVRENLAFTLYQMRRLAEAADAYRDVLRLDPNHTAARKTLQVIRAIQDGSDGPYQP